MKHKYTQFYGFGLPLAALIAALLGATDTVFKLVCAKFAVTTLALAAPDALRRGTATVIRPKKLMGCANCAVALSLLSGAIWVALAPLLEPWLGISAAELRYWAGAAAAMTVIQCVAELFAAQSDYLSAHLAGLLGGFALAGSILALGDDPARAMACCAATGGVAVLLLLLTAIFNRKVSFAWSFSFLREAPWALFRLLLYPICCAALLSLKLVAPHLLAEPKNILLGFFSGLAVLALTRSTFRRSESESVAMFPVMLLLGIAAHFASIWAPAPFQSDFFAMLILAMLCSLWLYAPLNPKKSYMLPPVLATFIYAPAPWNLIFAIPFSILILFLNLDSFRTLLHRMGLKRIQPQKTEFDWDGFDDSDE